MAFLRLYLGDLTGLFSVIFVAFVVAAMALRFVPENDRLHVRTFRNWALALIIIIFVIGIAQSLVVNTTPRGKVDRSGVDRQQQKFEERYSGAPTPKP